MVAKDQRWYGTTIFKSKHWFDGVYHGISIEKTLFWIQLHPQKLKQPLRAAVETTHVGYFQVGAMTQGLGWEQYAYAAFIPQQKIGIVMLANTNFPNEARITASYHVMQQLLQKNTAQ